MTQTDTDKPNLKPRQIQTIAVLVQEGSVTSAATKARVGRKTLYRWMDDPVFKAAYQAACDRLWSEIGLALQAASTDAVRVLREILNDTEAPKAVRVSAARALVPMTLQLRELLIVEERLRTLEADVLAAKTAASNDEWTI